MRKFTDPWDAYRNDPAFKKLVDIMTACISQGDYTPSEVRQAAIMACIRFEQMRIVPQTFFIQQFR